MADYDDLYEGLQRFREYVEANMPFKQTVYFGTLTPPSSGFPANLGAFYFKLNAQSTLVEAIFYKGGLGTNDWTEFGSGSSTQAVGVPAAGLNITRLGTDPYGLELTLTNYDGTDISFSSPLILPFRNTTDINNSGYFTNVNFVDPAVLTLDTENQLGLTPDVPSKIYVYLGVNVADVNNKIIAVKGNTRLDSDTVTTVYDLLSGDSLTSKVYSSFSDPFDTADYNLRLISVIDVIFSSTSGWGSPDLVTSYSPEIDEISDKLLSSVDVGIALRQQINDLTKPDITLKDFQRLYNNLVVQTYYEQNNINIFSIGSDSNLSVDILLQNHAINVNPLASGTNLTIPQIANQRTLYVSNSSATIPFNIVYDDEILEINPTETRHLNFCGTSFVTTPKIRQLDNKVFDYIPNYFGMDSLVDTDNSRYVFTAKHPLGTDLSSTNYIQTDLNLVEVTDTEAIELTSEFKTRQHKFTSNLTLNVPFAATLGLSVVNPSTPQRIFIYVYSTDTVQGLAISGVSKLQESKLHNLVLLTSSSTSKAVLYGPAALNNVSIKCIGYYDFIKATNNFIGVSGTNYAPLDEKLNNFYDPFQVTNWSPVTNNDTILESFQKLQNSAYFLKQYCDSLSNQQNIGLLEVDHNEDNDTYSLELSPGYDEFGLPISFGQRYVILDFQTSETVTINNTSGAFLAVEVVDANVTLEITDIGFSDSLVLAGPNKKYLIWVSKTTDFDASEPRLRIISEYPVATATVTTKTFKTVNTVAGLYNSVVNDALVLSNTTTAFTINLPTPTSVGDCVYMYFSNSGVTQNYTQNYTIAHPINFPFYQTTDSTIVVDNGGFYLKFEYISLNSSPYWFVTSGEYNIQTI